MNPKASTSIDEPLASFNPNGLKALLVDHNPTSLFVLAKMLQTCHYQVTPCQRPSEALSMIKNGESKFDIVVSEVHFSSDITGIQFLEIIDRETDLPLVIVSSDERNDMIIKCIKKGACAYFPKPVRMEVVRLLWQHVARKKMLNFRPVKQICYIESGAPDSSSSGEDKEFCGSSDGGFPDHRKIVREDEQDKVEGKKRRLVWTDELHQQFLDAVKQLGLNNAVPKKVLEMMNVPGLTRENVASHLQKYRLNLQKQTNHIQESFPVTNSGTGIPVPGARLGHCDITEPLPLDQYGMDITMNPCVMLSGLPKMENDRATCFALFPASRHFSGRITPADSFAGNGYTEAMQFVVQPTNNEDLNFGIFDELD